MENIKQIMNNLKTKITYRSEICTKHNIPFMVHPITGLDVCPRCEKERQDAELSAMISKQYWDLRAAADYNVLQTKSIIEDRTLMAARFETYLDSDQEEQTNKRIVMNVVERYKQGEKFNLILQGKPGTGKSHLGYSTLFELNETRGYSCLFISIDGMLRKIKNSFQDKESKYTEEYFNQLLSNVDFLCLDDLGAETGAIDSDKRATDFVQRVLYGVTNVRQDKSTILTTNLDSKTLFAMYDKKLISRLLRNPEFVIFKDSKDKRLSGLPF